MPELKRQIISLLQSWFSHHLQGTESVSFINYNRTASLPAQYSLMSLWGRPITGLKCWGTCVLYLTRPEYTFSHLTDPILSNTECSMSTWNGKNHERSMCIVSGNTSAHWHCCSFIDSSQTTGISILPGLNLTDLTCKDDFFERNFTCLPRCDRWDERPQNAIRIVQDIVLYSSLCLRILIVGLLLLLFAIRRKAL